MEKKETLEKFDNEPKVHQCDCVTKLFVFLFYMLHKTTLFITTNFFFQTGHGVNSVAMCRFFHSGCTVGPLV